MSGDGNDSWDPYLDDEFDSIDRASWNEDDWEQFLLRQDCLNAKYQELYETVREHPNRDAIIAREMHWHLPDDLYGDDLDAAAAPDEDDDEQEEESWLAREEAFVADLEEIPAYRIGQDFALAVDRRLTARLRQRLSLDEDAARSVRAAIEVAGHIASGHSIGYERDTLCGNIACCNRAQRSLAECLDRLLALRQRGVLTPAEANALLAAGREASDAIAHRIDELRRGVWWC